MNKSLLLLCLVIPLVSAYYADFGPFNVTGLVLVYKGAYLNVDQHSRHEYVFSPAPERRSRFSRFSMFNSSAIEFNGHINPIDANKPMTGHIEFIVASEEVFKHMGYEEGAKRVICCDPSGLSAGKCTEPGRAIVDFNKEHPGEYSVVQYPISKESDVQLYHPVTKTGVYFVVATVCDANTQNVHVSGKFAVHGTYGHLPSITYGSLDFYSIISIIYVVLTLIWLFACYIYSHDIMSVQYTIIIVLLSFTIDAIVKVIYLNTYNNNGVEPYTLGLISIAINCFTKTITRILTLVVSMGLGVSSPTLGVTIFKLLVLGGVYFVITFWDTYCTVYSVEVNVSYVRLTLTTLVDTIIYFLIFQALVNTMEELTDKNQSAKLSIFKKFRNIIIAAVIVSTITILSFTYIAVENRTEKIWTYQWFINEGVWSCFYLAVLGAIMILWRPTENVSAYAYRMQIATEEKQDDEEYGLAGDKLVDEEEEEVQAVEVVPLADEMKPMTIEGSN